jgi:hypothetical protein
MKDARIHSGNVKSSKNIKFKVLIGIGDQKLNICFFTDDLLNQLIRAQKHISSSDSDLSFKGYTAIQLSHFPRRD